MWHPLRLAEDFATVDILTGGRIVFGVGRGYHTREVETFGSPLRDQEANRALFEEQVDIIFKAFNNERFSYKGKYYTLPPEVPYRGYNPQRAHPRPATFQRCRSSAGNRSRAARCARSSSWPSTASRAW